MTADPVPDALREAARQLFEERGFGDTRVVDIAERAGVTTAGFYCHFKSKDAAFQEVIGLDPPDADEETPATIRGRRTRRALLDAARAIFERDGFGSARIADIAHGAGVASGTFYTYFDSKEDALHALAREIASELLGRSDPLAVARITDPVAQIRETIKLYLDSYAKHGRLLAVFDRAAAEDQLVASLEHETWRAFVSRAARRIRRLQADGLADPNLDADTAASALAAMVGQFAYIWINVGEPYDPEVALETLTRLWAQGIGLRVPPPSRTVGDGKR